MRAEVWSEITCPWCGLGSLVLVADNDAATCGPDGCAVPAGHA